MYHIQLSPPTPFDMSDKNSDFDTFIHLTEYFLEGISFKKQVRVMYTLLTPSTFRVCRLILESATSWSQLKKELREILGETQSLASAICEFTTCRKLTSETIQQFANRLRFKASKAYPDTPRSFQEPYLIAKFISSLDLSRVERNMLSMVRPETLAEAVQLVSNLEADSLELHYTERAPKVKPTAQARRVPAQTARWPPARHAVYHSQDHLQQHGGHSFNSTAARVSTGKAATANCAKPLQSATKCLETYLCKQETQFRDSYKMNAHQHAARNPFTTSVPNVQTTYVQDTYDRFSSVHTQPAETAVVNNMH